MVLQTKQMKLQVKGFISLYLCLVLAVIIPLLVTMIEAARYSAMRLTIECAVDIGMDSVLAEYNRELLSEYGLFLVDTSYAEGIGSLDYTRSHLEEYMDYNLNPEKGLLIFGSTDLLGLSLQSCELTKAARATDNDGEVFRYAVMQYMLEQYGIAYVQDVMDMVNTAEEKGILDGNIIESLAEDKSNLINYDFAEDSEEDFSDVEITDPSEGMGSLTSSGILNIVTGGAKLSSKSVETSQYASHRSLVSGDGLFFDKSDYYTLVMNLLNYEYVILMCGNYRNTKEDKPLDYQTEYVICGLKTDEDNLREVATRILLIRGGANTLYFFTDEELVEETKAAGEILADLICFPPIAPVFQVLIGSLWIYGESLYDVKHIFSGGRVPLFTTREYWNTSLENITNTTQELLTESTVVSEDEEGLNYEDYLRLLLYITGSDDVAMRTMDIIEMDIRKKTGNQNFRMDDCILGFETQMVVTSSIGCEFLIKKEFGYW